MSSPELAAKHHAPKECFMSVRHGLVLSELAPPITKTPPVPRVAGAASNLGSTELQRGEVEELLGKDGSSLFPVHPQGLYFQTPQWFQRPQTMPGLRNAILPS